MNCSGSESTKHPKYPCNTVLPRCARRKGGRHIDVPCFTYLGGGGRNGRPPIHLNYSLSNRQGPVIQFLVSGSLISLLARPAVPNHPMHRLIGLAEKGTTLALWSSKAKEGPLLPEEELTMPRRCDIDWKCIQEWSNYDLDFVEEAIRVEKALRAASPKRGFLAPR